MEVLCNVSYDSIRQVGWMQLTRMNGKNVPIDVLQNGTETTVGETTVRPNTLVYMEMEQH